MLVFPRQAATWPLEARMGKEYSPKELAGAIYNALILEDPAAFIQGSPEEGETIVDGTFNLERLATRLLSSGLGKLNKRAV
jgi:hypothetical protein